MQFDSENDVIAYVVYLSVSLAGFQLHLLI